MKKTLLFLTTILCSIEMMSQERHYDYTLYYRYQRTSFFDGIYEGYNDVSTIKTYRGALGINFILPIRKKTSLILGVGISNYGQVYENTSENNYRYYKFTYFKIPVLINFCSPTKDDKIFYPKISFGPQIGFLAKSKVLESSSTDFDSSKEIELPTDFSKAIIDICLKTGMDIRINTKTYLYFGINMESSLTRPLKTLEVSSNYNGTIYSGEFDSHLASIGLELGLTWKI